MMTMCVYFASGGNICASELYSVTTLELIASTSLLSPTKLCNWIALLVGRLDLKIKPDSYK